MGFFSPYATITRRFIDFRGLGKGFPGYQLQIPLEILPSPSFSPSPLTINMYLALPRYVVCPSPLILPVPIVPRRRAASPRGRARRGRKIPGRCREDGHPATRKGRGENSRGNNPGREHRPAPSGGAHRGGAQKRTRRGASGGCRSEG